MPHIHSVAAAIGDSARANMLVALMSGKALTATELAIEANISPQTASTHLQKLQDNHLITMEKQGRHKYFRLASPAVAELIESLMALSHQTSPVGIKTGPSDPDLRFARVCYDHLAGEAGVALMRSLTNQGHIQLVQNTPVLTQQGEDFFSRLGAPLDALKKSKRPLCKGCLDWSERQHHLAGSLGKWVLQDLFHKGWLRQDLDSRIVRFTESGQKRFITTYLATETFPA